LVIICNIKEKFLKNLIYIFTAFIFLTSALPAQMQSDTDPKTITVLKPVNGDAWERDIAHTIEWRITGEMDDRVKIRLFNHDGSVRIMRITDNTANNGSFRCPPDIFTDVRGGLYTIKVRTLNNIVTGLSERFWIGTPPTVNRTVDVAGDLHDNSPSKELSTLGSNNRTLRNVSLKISAPSIKIIFPKENHIYRPGSFPFTFRIEWQKTGIGVQDNNVKILLHNLTNKQIFTVLSGSTSNDGLYTHKFSNPGPRSGSYKISIKTLDGKISVKSKVFTIKNLKKKIIKERK